jgi:1,4-dihydroxy-2-naphthoate octaprenyltransferase
VAVSPDLFAFFGILPAPGYLESYTTGTLRLGALLLVLGLLGFACAIFYTFWSARSIPDFIPSSPDL